MIMRFLFAFKLFLKTTIEVAHYNDWVVLRKFMLAGLLNNKLKITET